MQALSWARQMLEWMLRQRLVLVRVLPRTETVWMLRQRMGSLLGRQRVMEWRAQQRRSPQMQAAAV